MVRVRARETRLFLDLVAKYENDGDACIREGQWFNVLKGGDLADNGAMS